MQTINLNRKFVNIWGATYTTAKWNVDSAIKAEIEARKIKEKPIIRNEVIKPHIETDGNILISPKNIVRCPECKRFVGSVQRANVTTQNNLVLICPHCNIETSKWVVMTIKKGYRVTATDFIVSENQIENGLYKEVVMQFLDDHKNKKFEVCHDQVIECCTAYGKNGESIDVEICED